MSHSLFPAIRSLLFLLPVCLVQAAEEPLTPHAIQEAFKEDWTPPAPVHTATLAVPQKEGAPAQAQREAPISLQALKASPAVAELKAVRGLQGVLKPDPNVPDAPTARTGLRNFLTAYHDAGGAMNPANLARIETFTAQPDSEAFHLNLMLEKAQLYQRHGHFVNAETAFREAWSEGKNRQDAEGRRLAEQALIGLLKHLAGTGRREKLRELFDEVAKLDLGGSATEALVRARSQLWFFENQPEQNVFCGFTAANTICVPLGMAPIFPDVHDDEEKKTFIRDGLSAYELKAHSHEGGGNLRVIKRTEGTAIPAPSVIHFAFGHYSAITETSEQGFRLVDDHLNFDAWVTAGILEDQLSGYFLVPGDAAIPDGFVEVGDDEAKTIFGRHCVHGRDDQDDDCPKGGNSEDCPMATYAFRFFNPGLTIKDTPIKIPSPYGPAAEFTLHYDQRSTSIEDLSDMGNFGPRWAFGYQTRLELLGNGTPNTQVKVVKPDGSFHLYNYNTTAGTYSTRFASRPQLDWVTIGGESGFVLTYSDGSSQRFLTPHGPSPTRYLLTQIVDTAGHALTFSYDASSRLTGISDALGSAITLSYTPEAGDEVPTDLTKIRRITDRAGRFARFLYTPAGRLHQIIDPVNIVSEFSYQGDLVKTLTTPYGTTTFNWGNLPGLNQEPGRFVEAIDPYGDKERIEANDYANYPVDGTEPDPVPSSIPVAGQNVSFLRKVTDLHYRNTFHWDKKQWRMFPGDHSKATLYNWLAINNEIVSSLHSIKSPLEGRIWFNYPGQTSSSAPGTHNQPSKTARKVERPDGTTAWALSQAAYDNLRSNLTETTDPEGRKIRYQYHANDIDLHRVQALDGGTWRTLVTLENYTNHRPGTVTDASGLVTTYQYNANGQTTHITHSKGTNSETTKYTYDADGWLEKIEHTSPENPAQFVTLATFTHDAVGRIRTHTDESGQEMIFDYDNIDRLTLITHPDTTTEQRAYTHLDLTASKDRAGKWTRIAYDKIRKPAYQMDPQGRITQFEWCKCGDLQKIIDPDGKLTHWKRDAQGRVIEKILPDRATRTTYTYHAFSGLPATVTEPNDQGSAPTATFRYSLSGQMEKIDYADPATPDVTFAHQDFLGRLTSMTDGIGTTNYAYHPIDGSTPGAGELHTTNGPWADDTIRTTYRWDGSPEKTEILTDTGTVTWSEAATFDTLGRLTSQTNGLGNFTTNYATGDFSARPESIVAPFGLVTNFTYHPQLPASTKSLSLASIDHQIGSNSAARFGYDYDTSGRITSWERRLGGVNTTLELSYNPSSELLDAVLKDSTNATLRRQSWRYDKSGNRVSTITDQAARTETSNALNQLIQTGGAGRTIVEGTIDKPGTVEINGQPTPLRSLPGTNEWFFSRQIEVTEGANTVEIEATDTHANSETRQYGFTVGPVEQEFEYDSNGNLLTDGERTFTWDAANRLTSVTVAGNTHAWEYDGLSRRVVEKLNGTIVKRFIWAGTAIAQQRTPANAITTNYHGNGEERFSGTDAGKYLYTTDHLGSIRELIDSTGAVRALYDYDPYGKRVKLSGDLDTEISFTGHPYHAASGLHLTLYRAYDAELGRWLSLDPIGEDGGINLYGYALNDPINLWDPNGMWPEWAPGSSSYSWGEYFSDVGQVFVGQAKGAANNLSFGLYKPCYENDMQGAGGWIGDGLATVGQLATGVGALKVGAKQATKQAGKEFSHWVPDRFFRATTKSGRPNPAYKPYLDNKVGNWFRNSMLNGNMVAPARHFKHDPFRYPKNWRDMGPRFNPLIQQLDRIPRSLMQAAGGFGYASGTHAARSGGDCQ